MPDILHLRASHPGVKRNLLLLIMTFMLSLGCPAQSQVPLQSQEFSLGLVQRVPDPGIPGYRYSPDGHIAYLPDGDRFQMYWPGRPSHRTVGTGLLDMRDPIAVLNAGSKGEFDNGGAWLYSVFRQDGKNLLGFYHGEDHEFAADPASHFIAWKSIALCDSADNGQTWRKRGQIITSARTKPAHPTWGGTGDFCVVRDTKNQRWLCFYQEGSLCMAASSDPKAKAGTWKKYFRGGFTEAGLGGENSPIPGLENFRGGNPSVHFNTFLKKWVMVWHTWDGERILLNRASLMLSTSDDLVHWNPPQVLLLANPPEKLWYPTIIGTSDVEAGQTALLCYARFPDRAKHEREFIVRTIVFGPHNPAREVTE